MFAECDAGLVEATADFGRHFDAAIGAFLRSQPKAVSR